MAEYDMNWIKQVRAAKGNTANTNTGAGQRTRTTSRNTSTSSGVTARGGGDVRRRVTASGGPRKMTLAEKQAYAIARNIKQIPYTGSSSGSKAVNLSSPSWYMGMKSVPSWIAKPEATYPINGNGSVKMYAFPGPVTVYRYYVHPSGEVIKVTRKGEIYIYPEGLYESAPYKKLSHAPAWLKDII